MADKKHENDTAEIPSELAGLIDKYAYKGGDDGLDSIGIAYTEAAENSKIPAEKSGLSDCEAPASPRRYEDVFSGRDDEDRFDITPESPAGSEDYDDIPAPMIDRTAFAALTSAGVEERTFASAAKNKAVAKAAAPAVKKRKKKSVLARIFPSKGDKPAEAIRKCVLLVSVCTMIVCCGILANTYYIQPTLTSNQNNRISQLLESPKRAKTWAEIHDKYPDVDFPENMQLKYAELYAQNQDFVGWLQIDGLGMQFAVVQGSDNDEYLDKNFYGDKARHGTIFVDYRTPALNLGRNTVLHGHNMRSDDEMFGKLVDYRSMDGFREAPVITYNTLFKDYQWKVYAVFLADASIDSNYYFNYCFSNLSSDAIFAEYITELDQRKFYDTGVDMRATDKILTLSTCVYDFEGSRLVVVARMVRDGESAEVDVSKVKDNPDTRFPDRWYSIKGKNNPYANGSRWYPQ